MKVAGRTHAEISIALGYYDESHVSRALRRHTKLMAEPHVETMRQLCEEQLSQLHRAAMRVLESTHLKVNNGYVVYYTEDPESNPNAKAKPLHDSAPVLAAIDRLLRIQESKRKLWGIDVPVKHEVSVSSVTVTVRGADDV